MENTYINFDIFVHIIKFCDLQTTNNIKIAYPEMSEYIDKLLDNYVINSYKSKCKWTYKKENFYDENSYIKEGYCKNSLNFKTIKDEDEYWENIDKELSDKRYSKPDKELPYIDGRSYICMVEEDINWTPLGSNLLVVANKKTDIKLNINLQKNLDDVVYGKEPLTNKLMRDILNSYRGRDNSIKIFHKLST